jgi:hypothetical protein
MGFLIDTFTGMAGYCAEGRTIGRYCEFLKRWRLLSTLRLALRRCPMGLESTVREREKKKWRWTYFIFSFAKKFSPGYRRYCMPSVMY